MAAQLKGMQATTAIAEKCQHLLATIFNISMKFVALEALENSKSISINLHSMDMLSALLLLTGAMYESSVQTSLHHLSTCPKKCNEHPVK